MSSSSNVPLRGAIFASLFMTFAFGVISGSVGLNSLIKSNQAKSHFKKTFSIAVVDINTNDIFNSAVVLTTVTAVIALLSLIYAFIHICARPLALRSLRVQAFIFAFCATWLFATQIPYCVFFANNSAKISATVAGIPVPPSVIKAAEEQSGGTSVYRHISYLRLVAIIPWFTWLFTVIATVVLFIAASKAKRIGTTSSFRAPVENTHDDAAVNEKVENEKTAA
ncbi:hypothetical protein H0H93_009430 [Arthromyces matolae]|nr:hypothetical protein H0H93_009430 [Arthromyces matolae]